MGLPIDDLAQEGAIGLLEAIDRFDPEKGASFSTYAFWRVRQSITHALTEHGRVLRLPKEILERRRAIATARADLANAGRAPTVSALADASHLAPAEVVAALAAPTTVASLDQPLENGMLLEEALADPAATDPEAAALDELRHAALEAAIAHLPDRQKAVITAHFGLRGEPMTLADVAAALHVSPSRARSIECDALHDLAVELEPALAERR
jgi:RNA polymerase primary sigma factor